jgi:hypothetical protein
MVLTRKRGGRGVAISNQKVGVMIQTPGTQEVAHGAEYSPLALNAF